MKKIALALVLSLIALTSFAKAERGLLWKVSGNGLEAPSYILGTYHLAPAEFIDSIPGLREAMAEVQAVYGEVEAFELQSPEAQRAMMAQMAAPEDSTLSMLLTEAEMAQLDSLLTAYIGFPGMVAQFEMFKPSAIATQLSMLQLSKALPKVNVTTPFDAVVMSTAIAAGKESGGLETIESQLKLLFGDPLTTQASDLMEAVRNDQKLVRQAVDLTNAYMSQDLDAVTEIMESAEYGATPEGLERLLYGRNRMWVDELQSILPAKSVLVVVGAGHLGGEQGVLNMLKNKGYTVGPVN